jgi:tetratricopeptide (TPR) repeat protein
MLRKPRRKIFTGEGDRTMKRHGGYLVFFILMIAWVGLTACSKPVKPTIYSGMKSEISREAMDHNAGGLSLAKEGRYREAIEAYKKAIMKEPAYTEAYVNCGKAYYAIGNYDMARYYNMKSKEILEAKATVIRESEIDQDDKL